MQRHIPFPITRKDEAKRMDVPNMAMGFEETDPDYQPFLYFLVRIIQSGLKVS